MVYLCRVLVYGVLSVFGNTTTVVNNYSGLCSTGTSRMEKAKYNRHTHGQANYHDDGRFTCRLPVLMPRSCLLTSCFCIDFVFL